MFPPAAAGSASISPIPIVVVGAVLFVLYHVGKGWPQWRIPGVTRWIGATSAVLALAIVHGWTVFGWTDWAFVNKGLGWLMLLCYAATGALIARRAQGEGFARLLQTFAASGVAIAALDIGLVLLDQFGVDLFAGLVERRIAGLSQNPERLCLDAHIGARGADCAAGGRRHGYRHDGDDPCRHLARGLAGGVYRGPIRSGGGGAGGRRAAADLEVRGGRVPVHPRRRRAAIGAAGR